MADSDSTKVAEHAPQAQVARTERTPDVQTVASGPYASLIALQRTAGNRAVNRALRNTEGRQKATHDQHRSIVQDMEQAFRMSFDGVTLRTDVAAARRASGLGARAYTNGEEIGFARHAFDPSTRDGMRTIAHEFAHVAQVRGGARASGQSGVTRLLSERAATKTIQSAQSGTDVLEVNAEAAAEAVVVGRQPMLVNVPGLRLALNGGKKLQVPASGSYRVVSISGGGYDYYFNPNDALSWPNPALTALSYYVKDRFPGATDDMVNDVAEVLGVYLEAKPDPATIDTSQPYVVSVDSFTDREVRARMFAKYPSIKPRDVQTGQHSIDQGEAGEGTAPGTGKGAASEPELTPEEQQLADELRKIAEGTKPKTAIDTKELVRLFRILKESVDDPHFSESGRESWVKFARFLDKNRAKIEGIIHSGPDGNLTAEKIEKIIAEYDLYIAAEPVEEEKTGRIETLEDYEKEFKYDPGWQRLSKEDRKLLIEYAKARPEDLTDEKVDFKRVTTEMKVSMALKLSDKTVLGETAKAAEAALSDPTFIITLIAILGIYVGLWLTPDPTLITKIAAGTLTAVLLAQFAWTDIVGLAKAWFQLEEDCSKAGSVAELKAAGDAFLTRIGPIGFDILLFIVMWRVGKRVGPKVQQVGARRATARAETVLAEAQAKPGSGKPPKATADTSSLLSDAKAAAVDPSSPTSVLDALANALPGSAKSGLAQFRSRLGDSGALKAIESTQSKGLDITHFLTEKGMSAEAVATVRAGVLEAHGRLARAKLIEIETLKDPSLRRTARESLIESVKTALADAGILRGSRLTEAVKSQNVTDVVSELGEAIGRTQLKLEYPAKEGYQVQSNVEIVREVLGAKTIPEWQAAERAAGRSGSPGGLYEYGGKLWKSITEVDAMVVKEVANGKLKPVELENVKAGETQTAKQAAAQNEAAVRALGEIAGGAKDVRIFDRPGKNTLGKERTAEYDLSDISSVKTTTRGLAGKTGFTKDVLYPKDVLVEVAKSLITAGGLPPTKPAMVPPVTTPRDESTEPEKREPK